MDIIDFRIRLRTSQMLKPWNPKKPAKHFEQYIKLYKMEPRLKVMRTEKFAKNMKKQGVAKGVVCGSSMEDNTHLMTFVFSRILSSYEEQARPHGETKALAFTSLVLYKDLLGHSYFIDINPTCLPDRGDTGSDDSDCSRWRYRINLSKEGSGVAGLHVAQVREESHEAR